MEFYGNELVKKSLKKKHQAFVMNSDETQLFRKAYFPGKVACKRGTRPIVVARDRSGSHVSLYITVSAIGRIVKPNILLHGGTQRYVDTTLFDDDVICMHTANGYMERVTFKSIMRDYFITYVKELRLKYHTDSRAVLVVDGHSSRYDAETFEISDNAEIDLIIRATLHNLWTSLVTALSREGFLQNTEKVSQTMF
jgi:hypothetical protein